MNRRFARICSWLPVVVLCSAAGCHRASNSPATLPVTPSATVSASEPSPEFLAELETCVSGGSKKLVCRDVVGEAELARIALLDQLEHLELYKINAPLDVVQGAISQLSNLRRLRLEDVAVDDDFVTGICARNPLEVLNLPNAEFSDRGLKEIAASSQIFLLRFGSRHVTDDGIASLAKSTSIRFLHLLHVPITDEGLAHFHTMKHLESFYIDGGAESEDGVWELLKANPGIHFHRNQLHVADDPNDDGH